VWRQFFSTKLLCREFAKVEEHKWFHTIIAYNKIDRFPRELQIDRKRHILDVILRYFIQTTYPYRTSPFPVRRENGTNNFVAAVATSNDILLTKCPLKCRPRDHPDWELCWQSWRLLYRHKLLELPRKTGNLNLKVVNVTTTTNELLIKILVINL